MSDLTTLIKSTPEDAVFILVKWPWVQELMDYDWFRSECLLYQAFDDQHHLDSAYFVPATRVLEITQSGEHPNFQI